MKLNLILFCFVLFGAGVGGGGVFYLFTDLLYLLTHCLFIGLLFYFSGFLSFFTYGLTLLIDLFTYLLAY